MAHWNLTMDESNRIESEIESKAKSNSCKRQQSHSIQIFWPVRLEPEPEPELELELDYFSVDMIIFVSM